MVREKGYYWIKINNEYEIGYFDGSGWQLVKSWSGDDIEDYICDNDLQEIDENQINRKP